MHAYIEDELVFADGEVNFIGQLIGIIMASSLPLAQKAAKTVQVTYEDLPSVLTIEVCMYVSIFFLSVPKL